MKLEKQPLERFLKDPAPAIAAALIFGPDEGMVHERAMQMSRAILGAGNGSGGDDPFRLTELTGDDIKADPARLIDEARAIAMMGGRRVVRVTRVTDATESAFATLLADHKDGEQCLVVVEAGDIGSKSSLKRLFENAPHAAAIACYRDEAGTLPGLITAQLKAAGMEIERDALTYLAANLGGDRGVTRAELEKLILYMGAEKKVSLQDALACIGDQAAIGQDDLCQAIGMGDLKGLERQLERNLAETNEISLLRAVARHFMRLHQVTSRMARGDQLESAMAGLRPPVFWKAVDSFKAQCRRWPVESIGNALLRLTELEAEAMRQHQFADTLTRRGLMEIAVMGAKR